jgi:hypothetical protein
MTEIAGLLNGTTYAGEYVAGTGTDQSDRANCDRQNDSEHYCILRDILAFFLPPSSAKKVSHSDPNLELPRTRHSSALRLYPWEPRDNGPFVSFSLICRKP